MWSHVSLNTSECDLSVRISITSSMHLGVVRTCTYSCPVRTSLRTDGDTTCDKNKEQQRIDWFQRYLTQILSCHAETEEQLRRQGLNSPCRWASQDLPRSILKGWAIPSLAKSWGKRRWDGFISSLSSLLMRARRSYSFVIPLHLM